MDAADVGGIAGAAASRKTRYGSGDRRRRGGNIRGPRSQRVHGSLIAVTSQAGTDFGPDLGVQLFADTQVSSSGSATATPRLLRLFQGAYHPALICSCCRWCSRIPRQGTQRIHRPVSCPHSKDTSPATPSIILGVPDTRHETTRFSTSSRPDVHVLFQQSTAAGGAPHSQANVWSHRPVILRGCRPTEQRGTVQFVCRQ